MSNFLERDLARIRSGLYAANPQFFSYLYPPTIDQATCACGAAMTDWRQTDDDLVLEMVCATGKCKACIQWRRPEGTTVADRTKIPANTTIMEGEE